MIYLPISFVLTISLTLGVFCQNKPSSSELKDKTSLTEILTLLGQIIPQAQPGLNSNFPDPQPGEIITEGTRYSESAEFSRGFRLSEIEGCRIKLTNDNAKLEEIKKALQNPPLKVTLKGSGASGQDESMIGDRLSFLFDSRNKAEEFDASFRLAVNRCQ